MFTSLRHQGKNINRIVQEHRTCTDRTTNTQVHMYGTRCQYTSARVTGTRGAPHTEDQARGFSSRLLGAEVVRKVAELVSTFGSLAL
ncbi:hypothetical protein NDU88_005800 [Pleurodeles waltl]|uniref:Uncharacterized protein n=1 Tax=Pleurodeles waltl TaxID=8319 RepID=A0AAV7L452_PLEWA|nr:hypothetical protein NDU88_005800 [Pleurodeles waltl]